MEEKWHMITTLTWEPYEREVGDGWDQKRYWKQTFWKVLIPDRLISDRARPFTPADAELTLHECLSCGHCGLPSVLVRAVGPVVAWINKPNSLASSCPLGPDEMLIFDKETYGHLLPGADVEDLPNISDADLADYLRCLQFPDPQVALYREPESPNDPQGQRILAGVRDAIASHVPDTRIVSVQGLTHSLRIRLDMADFPECVWEIADVPTGYAICFQTFPTFPVWLASKPLSDAIASSF
jgi:hypothetical protein